MFDEFIFIQELKVGQNFHLNVYLMAAAIAEKDVRAASEHEWLKQCCNFT